jgi:hypothetical protein
LSRSFQRWIVIVCLAAVAAANVAAAEQSPADSPTASSTGETEQLQEVTVTAKHLQLDWAQRNELVQKSIRFVFGITAVDEYGEYPPRWIKPVCPLVSGLPREQGEFVFARVSEIARIAGAPLGNEECHPNLYIFVTAQPKELLRYMKKRQYLAIFGSATSSHVDQFINDPAAIKVWHHTFQGVIGYGPVNVVVDRTQLQGVSKEQLADYVGMVSLAQFKSTAHFGDTPTILKLFDGPPQTAPEGLSDWDQAFLKMVYHPVRSLANPRALIGRRMVDEIVP